jgi:hypothetical protein
VLVLDTPFLRSVRVAIILGVSCAAAACNMTSETAKPALAPSSASSLVERPTTLRSETMVGKWGMASYRQEKDRNRVEAQARDQCKLPYTITRGPTDGVMMHVADDAKLYELRLKGASNGKTYLGLEAPPGHPQDREIISMSNKRMVMRFSDPDADNRYGTFIYVRCVG